MSSNRAARSRCKERFSSRRTRRAGSGSSPLFGGGGHDTAHGGAEGSVNVPQAGLAGKDLPAALVQLGLPALAGLVKAGNGPLHDDTVV